MRVFLLLGLLQLCWWTNAQDTTFLITFPKVIRLDATENIMVQLFGHSQEAQIHLHLKKTLVRGDKEYDHQVVILNEGNNYQKSVSMRLHSRDFPAEDDHVFIEAVSNLFSRNAKIPVARNNGFIFIQTDKPIYTPEQPVKVRVYSLNEELRPAGRAITLTFTDPEGIAMGMVDLEEVNGVLLLKPDFKIPINPKFGVWKVKAAYTSSFSTIAKAEFEVKEYVLPSIAVQITPEQNYVSASNFESFKVTITARYVHGAPVESAKVFVKIGHMRGDDIVMVPQSLRLHVIQEGTVEVYLNLKRDLATMPDGPRELSELTDRTLYVGTLLQETDGGISQEAELANVKFVDIPYNLSLIATPPFLKPSLPYSIMVLVQDPLGKPVGNVQVKATATLRNQAGEVQDLLHFGHKAEFVQTTRKNGIAQFTYNIPGEAATAQFSFITDDENLPPSKQGTLQLNSEAYRSTNQRYVYIDWSADHSTLEVGQYANIKIHFHYRDYLPLNVFSYQVISRGKVLHYSTEKRADNIRTQSINFQVTAEMVPSVRLLVYYILSGEATAELVADSIWIDVKAKCIGGLKVDLSVPKKDYEPKHNLSLTVNVEQRGKAQTLIGLSAVDTALYSLRINSKDPLATVLKHIEQKDLGCGGGGGKNNADVFSRAGLAFMTNSNAQPSSGDEKCSAVRVKRSSQLRNLSHEKKGGPGRIAVRRKRSDILNDRYQEEAKKYHGYSPCCLEGTEQVLTYSTCRNRAMNLNTKDQKCKKAFYDCCLLAEKLRTNNQDMITLSRSAMDFLEDSKSGTIRSYFPESWLWEEYNIDSKSLSIKKTLPDSLTTWEIKAVGMFKDGLCVAEPVKFPVRQAVSVNVPLPYSMVRGEQIELKGSVYNQEDGSTQFRVRLKASKGVCVFQGTGSENQVNSGKIGARSVALVRFHIMALHAGEHKLTFTLQTNFGNDIVEKTLRVVPEGNRKEHSRGKRIDPMGVYGRRTRVVEIQNIAPENLVPFTSVERVLMINGEVLGEVLSIVTDPKGLQRLTNLPQGTAEMQLMSLLPLYYVYDYLDSTEQWDTLGAGLSASSKELKRRMAERIGSIMSFKSKREYSFSMYNNEEPSTWLTALVVKTLAETDKYHTTDRVVLTNIVNWLITRCQERDGSFKEVSSRRPTRLMGAGADAVEQKVYLTSFVVIAIKTALDVPKSNLDIFASAVRDAEEYISSQVSNLKSLYVKAIAAYALTLVDPNSIPGTRLMQDLERRALVKKSLDEVEVRFWGEEDGAVDQLKPGKASAKTVETTVYVLLNLMIRGRASYAKPTMTWLTQDQRYGGGVYSTQDTILTLEALIKYSILVKSTFLNMVIDARYRGKEDLPRIKLTQAHPVGNHIEVLKSDDIILSTAMSSGVSFATLRFVYYEMSASNEDCPFDISIDIHPHDPDSNDPTRQLPRIVACAKFKPGPNDNDEAGRTLMEINLPTGFSPHKEDLDMMERGFETYISSYEIIDDKVNLEFDSISSKEFNCIGFRIIEEFQVGLTKASVFKVSDYYDQSRKCTKLYQPLENRLLRLCEGEQCMCMSAECCNFKSDMDTSVTVQQRTQQVCKDTIKYVLQVQVESSAVEGDFVKYKAKVKDVLKTGTEDVERGSEVELVKKSTCSSTNIIVGEHYLVMGSESMQVTDNHKTKIKFPLDSKATVEVWPAKDSCTNEPCSSYTKTLDDFADWFVTFGCM